MQSTINKILEWMKQIDETIDTHEGWLGTFISGTDESKQIT